MIAIRRSCYTDKLEETNVAQLGEEAELKPVLHFAEDVKPLVLNWTNLEAIAEICGSYESDDWIGKKIVLYKDDTITFGGKQTGGTGSGPRKSRQLTQHRNQSCPSEYTNEDLFNQIRRRTGSTGRTLSGQLTGAGFREVPAPIPGGQADRRLDRGRTWLQLRVHKLSAALRRPDRGRAGDCRGGDQIPVLR